MGPGGAASFAGSRCRSPQRQISKTGGLSLAGGTDEEGEPVHPYARDDGEMHQASLTQRWWRNMVLFAVSNDGVCSSALV